nr:unnamed protein product [Callosobruchus chinensis]
MESVKNGKRQSDHTCPQAEYTRIETASESDAVHSRFCPEDPETVQKYEKENYYYCPQCKLYFAPSYQGLYMHFTHPIVRHDSCGSCLYCKGSVYEYHLNIELRIYHNCKDSNERVIS